MIGDRPDTDILLGYKAGIDTCHVMTGVVSSDEEIAGIIKKDKSLAPTYRMKSFGVFG